MRRLVNGILWSIGLLVVLFVYFFVPVGRFTLFEHTRRIADTEPAQELGRELGEAGDSIRERAVDELEARRNELLLRDAGATPR
jgi:hypothetical protein